MSQVQVTLTFSSIALAIAAMSKIGADALVAGGDVTVVTHAGNAGAAAAADAPAPAPKGKAKSTSADKNSAAPAAADSSATKPEAASTPAAASPAPATGTSASTGSAVAADFSAANFLPQKVATLASPAIGSREAIVAVLGSFKNKDGSGDVAKKATQIADADLPAFLLATNELISSNAKYAEIVAALKAGVGGVVVTDAFIPAQAEAADDLT